MIRALLFDFDGVIVDTEIATYQAWVDVYHEHGAELALEDWLPAVGTGTSVSGALDAVAYLERQLGKPVDREAVIERRTRRKAELYERAPLRDGVRERLAEAQVLGLTTAIVTRNREDRVRAQCSVVGLEHGWDLLVCANEEPTRDKTDLYRHALELLTAAPEEAVAFEDSPSGLEAARRAGVACVAVPSEITRGAAFPGAALILPALADATLEEILERVQRSL